MEGERGLVQARNLRQLRLRDVEAEELVDGRDKGVGSAADDCDDGDDGEHNLRTAAGAGEEGLAHVADGRPQSVA